MDKEQLSELVFASETLQKNLEEFKKMGDFSQMTQKLSQLEFLTEDFLKQKIDTIDFDKMTKKAFASGEQAFLESTNKLIESQKAFEKAQKKAEEAVKLVDLKVLHEAADNTKLILDQHKKIRKKSIFFMGLFMFCINFAFFYVLLNQNIIDKYIPSLKKQVVYKTDTKKVDELKNQIYDFKYKNKSQSDLINNLQHQIKDLKKEIEKKETYLSKPVEQQKATAQTSGVYQIATTKAKVHMKAKQDSYTPYSLVRDEIVEIESCDDFGWCKLLNKSLYIQLKNLK